MPFQLQFNSEIDADAQRLSASWFGQATTTHSFGDIRTRDAASVPTVDLYVCGFPCQPFSVMGTHGGFEDTRHGGNVFFSVHAYLRSAEPSAFLLENVPGLMSHAKGKTFESVMRMLAELPYEVKHAVLNTSSFGIPHNRRRLYIVGVHRRLGGRGFHFPVHSSSSRPQLSVRAVMLDAAELTETEAVQCRLTPFEWRNVQRAIRESAAHSITDEPHTLNCNASPSRIWPMRALCGCLCTSSCVYVTAVRDAASDSLGGGRKLVVRELQRLQGFVPETRFPMSHVPVWTARRLLGNTMSVDVLMEIFARLLPLLLPPAVADSAPSPPSTSSLSRTTSCQSTTEPTRPC